MVWTPEIGEGVVENYIRDSSEDISKMVTYLLHERVTREIEERSG